MKIIALTSADEVAMAAVAEQLLAASTASGLQLSVLLGIDNAHDAQAVYADHGELWRVGQDSTRPELDPLVDRVLWNVAPAHLAKDVAHALHRFLNKTVVAT